MCRVELEGFEGKTPRRQSGTIQACRSEICAMKLSKKCGVMTLVHQSFAMVGIECVVGTLLLRGLLEKVDFAQTVLPLPDSATIAMQ